MKFLAGFLSLVALVMWAPPIFAATEDSTIQTDSSQIDNVSAATAGCEECQKAAKEKLVSRAIDDVLHVVKEIRPEGGFGIDHFTHSTPQIWWEPQQPHYIRFNKPMARIGIIAPLGKGFNLHLAYENLAIGGVTMWSRAIADDTNYWACMPAGSKVRCKDLSTWIGKGDVTDYLMMLDHNFKVPYVKNTNLVFGFGVTNRKPTWEETIPDFTNGIGTPRYYVHVEHDPKRIWAGAFDLGLRHRNWEIAATYRATSADGDIYPAGYHNGAFGLELVYTPFRKN